MICLYVQIKLEVNDFNFDYVYIEKYTYTSSIILFISSQNDNRSCAKGTPFSNIFLSLCDLGWLCIYYIFTRYYEKINLLSHIFYILAVSKINRNAS